VLAVTAYAGRRRTHPRGGAEGYLAKPVSIGPFMQAVMEAGVSPWPETTVPGQKPGRTGNATR
jgi:hypothetical protein